MSVLSPLYWANSQVLRLRPGRAFKLLLCWPPDTGTFPAVSEEFTFSMDNGIKAIQLSPCRAGLDRRTNKRFLCTLPFRTCYFPLCLSASGGFGDPVVSRSTTPWFPGDQSCRGRQAAMVVYINAAH